MDERGRDLAQLARQTLEIPVPVYGHEVCGTVRALDRAVREELLQPCEAPWAACDCWGACLYAELAQWLDLLDPRRSSRIGRDVAASAGARAIWLVERQGVGDVGAALDQRGDLV